MASFPAQAFFSDPDTMAFRAVPVSDPARCGRSCALVIEATGAIKRDTPQVFARFLGEQDAAIRAGRLRAVVLIDSPGGEVAGAMILGMMFRELKATVVVARPPQSAAATPVGSFAVAPGTCYSACVYALLGGRARVVPDISRVGVHRMHRRMDGIARIMDSDGPDVLPATRGAVTMLGDYLKRMGASQDLLALAESVPHDRIHRLDQTEMRRLRIVAGRP